MSKLSLAFAGLTACSGCQLTLLNCESDLPVLADRFDFSWFPMGVSSRPDCPRFDVAFVEGAVSTPEDLETLLWLRSVSSRLVAFGTCAAWGGIATIGNQLPRDELFARVYDGRAAEGKSFSPEPFDRFVNVDFTIVGCPPEKSELIRTLASLVHGSFPVFPAYPVCTECRNRENRCLLIEDNQLCLGPLIQSGCNARCPASGIVCEGCRGPALETNVASEVELLAQKGFSREDIRSRLRRFYPEWDNDRRY